MHVGRVLSREDTRNLTRDWLVEHVPAGTKIVVEPGVVPDGWAQDIGTPSPVDAERQPLGEVPDEPLAHRPRHRGAAAGARASS